MLNLIKWMYLASLIVVVVILSLSYTQKQFSSEHSLKAFVAKNNLSYPATTGLAGNVLLITGEQDINAQLFHTQQVKFTKSGENSEMINKGSSIKFNTKVSLTLPFPLSTLPAEKLLQQQWVDDLQHILSDIPLESPPIHIVAGNYAYRELLLNWLIMAKAKVTPPLSNIIVLSIDKALCDLLNNRNIRCIFVERKTYLKVNIRLPFHLILILRLTVIRLLNHWGYNAANIDADAIILKNPEPLYEEYKNSDMVAGRGTYPFALGREWGATICGGTFMIRSTPNTENYWRAMSSINKKAASRDDQVMLNRALKTMNPVWEDSSGKTATNLNREATLIAHASGFTVTLLSTDVICRRQCKEQLQSQYYVWHKLTGKKIQNKNTNTSQAGLWFLRKDWKTCNSSASGIQWLIEISDS